MTLLERTQRLLAERLEQGKSLREIAAESGGKVSRDWLTKFAAGKIENPGVNTIQALHDTLASAEKPGASPAKTAA